MGLVAVEVGLQRDITLLGAVDESNGSTPSIGTELSFTDSELLPIFRLLYDEQSFMGPIANAIAVVDGDDVSGASDDANLSTWRATRLVIYTNLSQYCDARLYLLIYLSCCHQQHD